MSLEPERDIEKTLRACAKQRREQAGTPPPMHPATRRLLQGEVARHKKRSQPSPGFWPQLLWGSWPRILLNSAVVLLLITCVLLLPTRSKNKNASQPQTLLAKNERSSDAEPSLRRDAAKSAPPRAGLAAPISAPTVASAPAPAVRSTTAPSVTPMVAENRPTTEALALAHGNESTTAGSREMPAAEKDNSTTTSSVAPAKPATNDGNLRFYSGNSSVALDKKQQPVPGSLDTLSASPPPAVAPPQPIAGSMPGSIAAQPLSAPPAVLTAGGVMSTNQEQPLADNASVATFTPPTVTQQFGLANPTPASPSDLLKVAKAPASPRILNSFRVEQTGDQLRVIDADGSVYSGSLQTSTDVSGQLFAYDQNSDVRQGLEKTNSANGPAPSVNNLFFRVTGTNLTLNQPVVFTGNFLADTRAPSPQTNITTIAGNIGGGGFGGAGRARTALGMATNLMSKNKLQSVATTPALQLSNTRLQGQALIGGTNQIPINALPVKP